LLAPETKGRTFTEKKNSYEKYEAKRHMKENDSDRNKSKGSIKNLFTVVV